MKSCFILVFCLFASHGVSVSAQSEKSATARPKKAIQALAEAEQKWLDAYHRLDTSELDAIESRDFTLITPIGETEKAEQLRELRDLALHVGTPVPSSARFDLSDRTIRIYGNVAVVSDICRVFDSPITSAGRYWQTEVWHYDDGMWKIVHLHISTMEHRM